MSTTPSPDAAAGEPAEVVVSFLRAWTRFDLDTALGFVTDDLVYQNASLPTVYGRDNLERIARPLLKPGRLGFKVHFNHVATDGDVVLTDRVDELFIGRFAARFWVYGRFEVHQGRIAVWRDAFDWLDVIVGVVRGLAGLAVPSLNREMPPPD